MHDVICKVTECLVTVLNIVGVKHSSFIGVDSTGQDVEESSFACTTCSHDGGYLASFEDATDSLDDLFLFVCFFAGYFALNRVIKNINRVANVLEDDVNSIELN